MSRTPFVAPALAASLALLAGCATPDRVAAPDGAGPTLDVGANAPESPGPNVERDFASVVFFADPSYIVFGGGADLTVEKFCTGGGGSVLFPDGQLVFTPAGGFHVTATSTDVIYQVFENSDAVTDLCDLAGVQPLAEGTGSVRSRLNATGPGAFVSIISGEGTVALASGGQATLSFTGRVVVRADGSVVVDRSQITLTPL